jgi:short-subunit dehydrogenase
VEGRAILVLERDHLEKVKQIMHRLGGRISRLLETPLETWDKVMAINARATYLTSRRCLPTLLEQGSGTIVNICTAAEPLRVPTVAAYRASKAAQRAFGQSLREELKGTGVKLLVVLPEPMDTPMRWEATPDFPRDKVISPDDVAATIHALVTGPVGVSVDEVFVRSP